MRAVWAVGLLLVLGSVILGQSAEARVFSFKNEGIASYLHGTYGPSMLSQQPYATSSGVDTSLDKKFTYNVSGELGLLWVVSDRMAFRLGVEALQGYPAIKEAIGSNPSGQQRMSVNSSVFAIHPSAALEYYFSLQNSYRIFGYAGAGYAMVTMQNNYTLTAQGTSDLGGITDYGEQSKATATSIIGGAGIEVHFSDTTTFLFDLNYRHLPVKNLTYQNSATGTQGAFVNGQPVLNDDGSKRAIDLSGMSVGIGFRFYIKVL